MFHRFLAFLTPIEKYGEDVGLRLEFSKVHMWSDPSALFTSNGLQEKMEGTYNYTSGKVFPLW